MSEFTPPVHYEVLRPVEVFVVPRRRRRYWLHALLLILTVLTTLVVGARLEWNFQHHLSPFTLGEETVPMFAMQWIVQHPANLLLGVPFSATLLAILLAHELGHFYYCLRYGVYATLPFFIPAPTLIGTLGAFIRIKSPIRSRSALFDIGIAGPIAGFVVAVPILFVALLHSTALPSGLEPEITFGGYPLIFHAAYAIVARLSSGDLANVPLVQLNLHPTAVAAWMGMFATALNLLPGGQLDGGHIVYSVAPRAHRWASRICVAALLIMGIVGFWRGWLVWAILLAFSGMRHPQVPPWPDITPGRRALAALALLLLVLTFVPTPFRIPR